jgi:hypothetical protein
MRDKGINEKGERGRKKFRVRGRKGKGENERERGREKGERKEMIKNETKEMKEREQGNERTWKSPYNWYSPHSSNVIARSIRVGKSKKRK